jgi:hypothetical protein
MRRIAVNKWKAKTPSGEELDDSILTVLNAVISSTSPSDMPRGIENFRLFKRMSNAFEKVEETGTLELEEADYSFLKRILEKGIPSTWSMNENINTAVETFLSAKEE